MREGILSYGKQDGLPPGRVASMTLDRDGRLIAMVSYENGTRIYRSKMAGLPM